jgi:hypothetical protein
MSLPEAKRQKTIIMKDNLNDEAVQQDAQNIPNPQNIPSAINIPNINEQKKQACKMIQKNRLPVAGKAKRKLEL